MFCKIVTFFQWHYCNEQHFQAMYGRHTMRHWYRVVNKHSQSLNERYAATSAHKYYLQPQLTAKQFEQAELAGIYERALVVNNAMVELEAIVQFYAAQDPIIVSE